MSAAALQPWQLPAADAVCRVAEEDRAFHHSTSALRACLGVWEQDPADPDFRARAEEAFAQALRDADRYAARVAAWEQVVDVVSGARADVVLQRRMVEGQHRRVGRGPDEAPRCTCRGPWPCLTRERQLAHVVQAETLLEVVDGLRAVEVKWQVAQRRSRAVEGAGSDV